MKYYALVVVATALVTLLLSWAVWRFGIRYRIYPAIRERDVHARPTPRLGGVAMYLGVVFAFVMSAQIPYFQIFWDRPERNWALLGATTLIVLVGVADDVWDLDWMVKLGAQFLAAGIVVGPGGFQIFALPIGTVVVVSSWLSFLVSVLAIVVVMNAINFIDGLDGLVAGVALIANAVFFAYTYLLMRDYGFTSYANLAAFMAVVLLGVCLGFLPLNWNPARMFMGDSGALMIGLLMACSALAVTGNLPQTMLTDNDVFGRSQLLGAFIPILLPIVVVLLPLLDFGMAVIRRTMQGRSPFSADRKHLHHRMLDMGHSDRDAVLIFYAWTAVASLSVLMMYIGTRQDWPGGYWPGIAFFVVGALACVVVTVIPARARSRSDTDERMPS
ncbi:MraY family glycosyltransferase [Microbacterium sp.]|uniref:MraY family glycosyltransferase n=1 Tax=Microbacterium sp. TaxID=51671 RepID=UPI003A89FFC4